MKRNLLRGLFLMNVLFLLSSNLSAAIWQTLATVSYQHSLTDSYSNEGRKVVFDNSNNVYVLSDHTSDLNPSGVNNGQTYYYVILKKYGPSGTLLNTVQINVNGIFANGYTLKSAFGLEFVANNIYIAYTTYNNQQYDIVIAKYNTSLVNQWTYNYNPTVSGETGIDFKVSSTGEAYALVESRYTNGNPNTFGIVKATAAGSGSTPLFSSAAGYFFNSLNEFGGFVYVTGYTVYNNVKAMVLEKRNSSGVQIWQTVYNGGTITSGDDIGNKIAIDPNGDIYVVGSTFSSASGNIDLLVIKYKSVGGRSWTRVINRSNNDYGSLIAISQSLPFNGSSALFVAGYSASQVTVYRLDPITGATTGSNFYNPVAAPVVGTTASVQLRDMKLSSRGNAYLTGSVFSSTSAGSLEAAFATSFSNRQTIGSNEGIVNTGQFTNSFSGISIAISSSGNVALLRNNYYSFTDHSMENVVLDIFQIGSAARFSSGEESHVLTDLLVYPNPFSDLITIQSEKIISALEIYDLTGKKVFSEEISSSNYTTNLSQFDPGIYLIELKFEDGTSTIRKIIRK